MRITAKIRKINNQYCVVSEDGTRRFGCFSSEEKAKKRLQEIEFFKHKGSGSMNSYNGVFDNFARALNDSKVDLAKISSPDKSLPKVDAISDEFYTKYSLKNGSIAGKPSLRLLDTKDHFPVLTETQAKSSMSRALQLQHVPDWYSGTLAELKQEVYTGILQTHPNLNFNVKIPMNQIVALSDGQTESDTKLSSIKDPEAERKDGKDEVPQVKSPNLSISELCQDDESRKTIANHLLMQLEEDIARLQKAKDLANRLLERGLDGEEFALLSGYCQNEVLHNLLSNKVEARRLELLKRFNG